MLRGDRNHAGRSDRHPRPAKRRRAVRRRLCAPEGHGRPPARPRRARQPRHHRAGARIVSARERQPRPRLADRARDRLRQRAGGGWQRVTLTGTDPRLAVDDAEQALALEAALTELERADARAARVVELHYFAGLTLEDVAQTLGVVRRTVD